MKLTKAQKEIIVMMQRGYKFQSTFSQPTLFKSGDKMTVRWDTIHILERHGLLTTVRQIIAPNNCTFHLTELGKTINL